MGRDIHELERWIEKHPRQAYAWTIGFAILVCEVALLLSLLTRGVQP